MYAEHVNLDPGKWRPLLSYLKYKTRRFFVTTDFDSDDLMCHGFVICPALYTLTQHHSVPVSGNITGSREYSAVPRRLVCHTKQARLSQVAQVMRVHRMVLD